MPTMDRRLTHNAIKPESYCARGAAAGSRPFCSAELLDLCNAGHSDAWDTLIEQNERAIYSMAYRMCHNHDDAGDIVSQVFVRLYMNLHTLSAASSFSGWLVAIVRNAYFDMCIRSRWRTRVSLDAPAGWDGDELWLQEVADPAPTPEKMSLRNETSGLLLREMQHLPAGYRQVLTMYVEEGKSYQQISVATGLPIGTVRSRLNRARHNLQDRLMPYRDILLSA